MHLDIHLQLWRDGLADELSFWDRMLATGGGEWSEGHARGLDPVREIEERHLGRLDDPATAQILDVGAGPMTVLGSHYRGRPLSIRACDPLAPLYEGLLARHGVRPPIPTVFAAAEALTETFEPESFDLVFCQNALDHTFAPYRAVVEMLRVTRTGGWIRLGHNRNEAVREAYQGLHQWNLDAENDRFVIWRPDERIDVAERLGASAHVEVQASAAWMWVMINKLGEPPLIKEPAPDVRPLLNAELARRGLPLLG